MKIQRETKSQQHKFLEEGMGIFAFPLVLYYQLSGIADVVFPLFQSKHRGYGNQLLIFFDSFLFVPYPKRVSRAFQLLSIELDAFEQASLNVHEARIRQFLWIASFSTITAVVIFLFWIFLPYEQLPDQWRPFVSSGVLLLYVLAGWTAYRTTVLLIRKYYADTLFLINGLYLLLELLHSDKLTTAKHRLRIQRRLNFLSQSVNLLMRRYESASIENNFLIYCQFKNIEEFIRERERLVVFPKKSTYRKLWKDFTGILPALLTGNYGDLPSVQKEWSQPAQVSLLRRVATGTIALLGIVIPGLFLYYIYVKKAALPNNMDINIFTAAMVGLLLLTVDSVLKLGLVESLIATIKGVRELSSSSS
jgi:hypothetical protein